MCWFATSSCAALVLDLAEQPRVLDRDHRLVGEGLEQRDLLVGEGLGVIATDEDRADASAFPEHRRPDRRLDADRADAIGATSGAVSRDWRRCTTSRAATRRRWHRRSSVAENVSSSW